MYWTQSLPNIQPKSKSVLFGSFKIWVNLFQWMKFIFISVPVSLSLNFQAPKKQKDNSWLIVIQSEPEKTVLQYFQLQISISDFNNFK